jgi:hypothetical protein
MRRWRERYEEFGFRGLFDRRRAQAFPKARTSSFAKNSILLWVTKILFQAGQATNFRPSHCLINRIRKIDFGNGFAHPRPGEGRRYFV